MKNRLGSNTELQWCCVPTISTDTDLILPIQVFYKIIAVVRKPSRFVPHMSSIFFFLSSSSESGLRCYREVQFNKTITAKTWPRLSGPVNEFSLLFHSWQEFLITAALAFFPSSNRLVKCHAKCKLINKHKLLILCSLYIAALQRLMRCPIQQTLADFF